MNICLKGKACFVSKTAILLLCIFLCLSVRNILAKEMAGTLRIAGFESWTEASKTVVDLEREGYSGKIVPETGTRYFYVEIGQYEDASELHKMQKVLRGLGYRNLETRYEYSASVQKKKVQRIVSDDQEINETLLEAQDEDQEEVLLATGDIAPVMDEDSLEEKELEIRHDQQQRGIRLSNMAVELGLPFSDATGADTINYLRGEALAFYSPSSEWEIQMTGRLDGHLQTGSRDYSDVIVDYGESFVRYRGDGFRFTAGAQQVVWGRLDFIPPNDLLSTRDISRVVADELRDQRRPSFAIRMENFFGSYKLDTLLIPFFRSAVLPEFDSAWSLVDRTNGRILTAPDNPLTAEIARHGQFDEEKSGFGGVGVRLSHIGDGYDYAFTIQRGKQSLPYFEINPALLATVAAGIDPQTAVANLTGAAFTGRHPETWSIGTDAGFSFGNGVLRLEAAWLSDIPVTRHQDFQMETISGVSWGVGYEFYPGDMDMRVNLQLLGRYLNNRVAITEDDFTWAINGEIENIHGRHRWRERVRFNFGIEPYDLYINPEIAYIGIDNFEFFLGLRIFDGGEGTLGLGKAYDHHDIITAGWRLRY